MPTGGRHGARLLRAGDVVGRFLARHPAHVSRPARRHVLHRPGDPDRPGARHRRRPRARARHRPRARGARPQQAALGAVLHLRQRRSCTATSARSVLTSNPVMQDIRRAFPATLELATLGTIIGAGLGVPLGVWAAVRRGGARRPDRARRRPDRLFGADLLARPDGARRVLRPARLGRRAGPHRHRLRVHADAGDRAAAARHRACRASGRPSATRCRTSSCRPRCSAISRSPTSAG